MWMLLYIYNVSTLQYLHYIWAVVLVKRTAGSQSTLTLQVRILLRPEVSFYFVNCLKRT